MSYNENLILGASILFQAASVVFCIRLLIVTKRYFVWGLISMALFVQALRRGMVFFFYPKGECYHSILFLSEVAGLFTSVLIFSGLVWLSFHMPRFELVQKSLIESKEAYRKLSNEFQILLDGIPDLLILLSPDLKVIWGNNAAAKMCGRTLDLLRDEFCYFLWPNRSQPCETCVVQDCFKSGKTENMKLETPDGKTWGVKAFPIKDSQGRVLNVIEMVSDISEQIKLREEVTRSNRLASLGELAAGVAHEINNPNAVILLNNALLGDAFLEALPILDEHFREEGDFWLGGMKYSELREEIPRLNSAITDGAHRIKRIVEDLKNFARSEEHKKKEIVDLNKAVHAAERLVWNVIKNSTHKLTATYCANLPLVSGHLQRLEQVAVNLILNACQSLEEKDKGVFVSTYHDKENNKVVLEVRDEGVGIPKEILSSITDPFFTTKRKSGGTGLGLSVSSRIVEDHGGTLHFISTPGKGTTVTVSLPVGQEC